jgi:hypothetical protein
VLRKHERASDNLQYHNINVSFHASNIRPKLFAVPDKSKHAILHSLTAIIYTRVDGIVVIV